MNGFNWSNYYELALSQIVEIAEATLNHPWAAKYLFESNSQSTIDYFLNLSSTTPIEDKTYIIAMLGLGNDQIVKLNDVTTAKLIGHDDNLFVVELENGIFTEVGNSYVGTTMIYHTFFFKSTDEYDKFRSEVMLKFNNSLPPYNTRLAESATADLKNLARAAARKFSAGKGTDQNPHPHDSFQGKVWHQTFMKAMTKLPQPTELITEAQVD